MSVKPVAIQIDITNTPDNVNWPVPPGERASHDLKST
ncbi:phage tail protein [Salmonella enterica]|nr:phage tail protein [Salmonella enterica]EAV4469083.1 phage tail protein [Salmonella enterica]EEA7414278.1 phage tail protein [Salmonella enterica]EEG2812509.1 phage tail protein [Salmonella enterica]